MYCHLRPPGAYIISQVSALQVTTTRSFLHCLKTTWTLVHWRLQIGRRTANGTQPNFAKRWMVNRDDNLPQQSWDRLSEKNWGQKLLHLFGFPTTLRLIGEYLQKKTWQTIGQKRWKGRKIFIRCPKILWTLVRKRLTTGLEFLPTITISFCPSPSHTLYASLTWRPTAINETTLGSSAAQIWNPKKMLNGKSYRVGRP